ncbi:sentrin-specific protease 6 isoform X2 [Hoplias malabaricus]
MRHIQQGKEGAGDGPELAQHTGSEEMFLINTKGPAISHEDADSEERTFCTDPEYVIKTPRKYRMRDQMGDLVPIKRKARSTADKRLWYLKFNRVTLSIRSLKLGTLDMNFRGSVTFSVEYIEIPDKVRITACKLTSCEWCTAHNLQALFLQTTSAEYCSLKKQLGISTDTEIFQSIKQTEKYVVLIFESEPTALEKIRLEEIFAEISRLNNISNFPALLTFEEANDRLKACQRSHKMEDVLIVDEVDEFLPLSSVAAKSETTTLSVPDSKDDDDDDDDAVLECPSSAHPPAKILVVYPPPPAKGGFSINEEDFHCLNEGEFLNDVIVDFYLKYLICEKLQREDASRCHVFSSFFYKSLTQKDHLNTTGLSMQERRHNRVKTWTRHLDLFEKDFVFVPINQSAHWYLAIICFPGRVSPSYDVDPLDNEESMDYTPSPSPCNPMSLFYRQSTSEQLSRWSASIGHGDKGFCLFSDDDMEDEFQYEGTSRRNVLNIVSKQPCILIMDSLSHGSKPAVVEILQEYLEMEWWRKKGSWRCFTKGAMSGWSPRVPQQDNQTDCGVYVLQYVESFITNPPQILHPAVDLSYWFPQKLVKRKRKMIKMLILRLQQQALCSGD